MNSSTIPKFTGSMGGIMLGVNWTRNATTTFNQAILSTNEIGNNVFQNYTGVYGSPYNFTIFSDNESAINAFSAQAFTNISYLNFSVGTARDYMFLATGAVNCTQGTTINTNFTVRFKVDGTVYGNTTSGGNVTAAAQPFFFVTNVSNLKSGVHTAWLEFADQGQFACSANNNEIFATPIYDYIANN
jgi:hypothetical protein